MRAEVKTQGRGGRGGEPSFFFCACRAAGRLLRVGPGRRRGKEELFAARTHAYRLVLYDALKVSHHSLVAITSTAYQKPFSVLHQLPLLLLVSFPPATTMDNAELEAARFLAAPLPILLSIALVYAFLYTSSCQTAHTALVRSVCFVRRCTPTG